jgi:hypothetical protein
MRKPRERIVPIECVKCSKTVLAYSKQQKYCEVCSAIAHQETKTRWRDKSRWRNLDHDGRAVIRHHRRTHQDGKIARGAALSMALRAGPTWYVDREPAIHSSIRLAIPFNYALSKNAIWRFGGPGHVYMRKEIRSTRDHISAMIRSSINKSGILFFTGKLWIDLFIQKPNHKSDAINMLDCICDAIKDALDIDDRWFAIRRLDWEIVKVDPVIYIGIGQEIAEDQRICAVCGRQISLTMFPRDRRECVDCLSVKRMTALLAAHGTAA